MGNKAKAWAVVTCGLVGAAPPTAGKTGLVGVVGEGRDEAVDTEAMAISGEGLVVESGQLGDSRLEVVEVMRLTGEVDGGCSSDSFLTIS